ncbi:hypothetical protein EB118_04010 [bacterium]|nr:hypothetical protein [Actinomycetota bacterium]NDG29251.1 hypothetical protein [bacterium]
MAPPPGTQITIIKEEDPAFAGRDPSMDKYTITNPVPPYNPNLSVGNPKTGGKRRRQTRTFPKGILRKTARIVPTHNPSKAPPTRKSVKIMTIRGIEKARKTAKQHAMKADIGTIRKKLIEKKIISPDKKNVPVSVLRSLYADSVGAGLLS